jgi:protein NEDD1
VPSSRLRELDDRAAATYAADALRKHSATASPARTMTSVVVPPEQLDMLKEVVEDSLAEFRRQIHRDVHNMHIDLIRQFEIQKNEMEALLGKFSLNEQLVAEIERLRQENVALRQKF